MRILPARPIFFKHIEEEKLKIPSTNLSVRLRELMEEAGMPQEDLLSLENNLARELNTIRADRDMRREELKRIAKIRDELNAERRRLRDEVRALRVRIGEARGEIQKLRSLRDEAKNRRGKIIGDLKTLRQKLRMELAARPTRSRDSLRKEIEEIEWRIQTVPHAIDEERKLIEKVKDLEKQIESYRRIDGIKEKIASLQKEADMLKDEIATYNDSISRILESSKKILRELAEKTSLLNENRSKADEMHRRYLEVKKEAQLIEERFREIQGKIKALKMRIHESEEAERARKEMEMRSKVEQEALEKLKRGEKISFEEFKLLAERGLI